MSKQYDDEELGILENPVGTYKYLNYQAWVLPNGATAAIPVRVGGVASQSPPVRILTSTDIQLQRGTPSFTVAAPYKSFGVYDFYFGCTMRTGEAAANAATQCTITVAGFVPNTNQEVAVASFAFTPPLSPVAPVPMLHAVLPNSFRQGLSNVTVVMDNKLANILVDNLVSRSEHLNPFLSTFSLFTNMLWEKSALYPYLVARRLSKNGNADSEIFNSIMVCLSER